LTEVLNVNISENPSRGEPSCSIWSEGQTDGRTDMTTPVVAFRNFANVPNKRPMKP